ncbi:periplasmic chaperone for outer membrane proteins Skp [Candidatus Kryptonium thompsonii]|uniref:Periplasmic chaperone for outer membrane proteins Skp n=1 Tax=Candidatus Kryptonium thompsonii TaxID=1633631 RepID=A0A0P1M5J6_9BACT|nr:OmpH family outer membrane protein [Candidatus Kryptonium thompsoni]CUS79650.1 periplasmic chaperone for outer membrane proteins Skp [Candidatus Kryptonium thompsoni]CUS80234.1 periplasmic chaperone for outer membrane proteins Skp [Candidatus Kryptonium thompsoni]CUS82595.1 periplasmic chaperone for outer membrane proteins Skp [Candidatus Kryptonium thompsoni]CUS86565.1 periplasmic chaperone for outer membrane proteins Skp [Candidatus Kryptonium thompsoni]CUS89825.1 periplasmic chaperone fo
MKLLPKVLILSLVCVGFLFPQLKIGYVDSETIMRQLPEAQEAQRRVDELIKQWQGELQKMRDEWKTKYDEYEKRKLILTDEARAQMEKELTELDRKIADFQMQKFGPDGELYRKQAEIVKPIQDKIFNAIKEVALEEGYDFVFDKSGEILLLYANEKYDLTQKVLNKLLQVK